MNSLCIFSDATVATNDSSSIVSSLPSLPNPPSDKMSSSDPCVSCTDNDRSPMETSYELSLDVANPTITCSVSFLIRSMDSH